MSSVLRDLGPDYTMLVTVLLNVPPLPLFSDLRAHLLSFETQTNFAHASSTASPTALFTATSSWGRGTCGGHENRGGHFGCGGRGRGFPNSSQYQYARSPPDLSILGPPPRDPILHRALPKFNAKFAIN